MQDSHNAKITFKLITGKHFAVTNKWDTTTKRLNWSDTWGVPTGGPWVSIRSGLIPKTVWKKHRFPTNCSWMAGRCWSFRIFLKRSVRTSWQITYQTSYDHKARKSWTGFRYVHKHNHKKDPKRIKDKAPPLFPGLYLNVCEEHLWRQPSEPCRAPVTNDFSLSHVLFGSALQPIIWHNHAFRECILIYPCLLQAMTCITLSLKATTITNITACSREIEVLPAINSSLAEKTIWLQAWL